jgi:hypothetical protein
MASIDDVNSTIKTGVTNLSVLGQTLGTAIVSINNIDQTLGTGIITLNNIETSLSTIATVLSNAFPQIFGSFTLSNATTTAVAQPGIVAAGFPVFVASNSTAALTQRTAGLFVSAVTAGVGFAISTQNGSAAGNETFHYFVYNPV